MIKLGVNIDHIATLRQARGINYPDPLQGAKICEESGAQGITVHLREDRRHIIDQDVYALKKIVKGKLNLEMALAEDIIEIAADIKPDQITLVPEKREELTTEGGLDLAKNIKKINNLIQRFKSLGTTISLFIEPDIETIKIASDIKADSIEIHTGRYCDNYGTTTAEKELQKIYEAAQSACELNLVVNAGHGLNIENIKPLLKIPGLEELNIGHSIISRAIFIGLGPAVQEMLTIIKGK